MSSQIMLIGMVAVGAAFFLILGYLGAKLLAGEGRSSPPRAESQPMRLQPALRLFSDADFEYLSSQPGFRPEMARRLRAERAKVFAAYLKQMGREFERLHRSLRVLTLDAGADRPEVSRALLEQQVLFSLYMAKARVRLAFFRLGVKPVETQGLVDILDQMRAQVGQLSKQPAAVRVGASA